MHHSPFPPAHADLATPLAPDELVTDQMLRDLARDADTWQTARLTREDQARLCMLLPDIIGQLLCYRAAARVEPGRTPAQYRNHAEEIAAAIDARDLSDRAERIEQMAQATHDELASLAQATQQTADQTSQVLALLREALDQ